MANIISLQFSDQIESVTGRLDYTGAELDNNDIDYWIGTEGNTIPYSNIRTTPISAVTSDNALVAAWNRNTVADSGTTTSQAAWTYFNYSILPNSISMAIRSSSTTGICEFVLEAENENGSYETIGSYSRTFPGNFGYFNFKVNPHYWSKSFRFRRLSGVTVRIDEIFMYGAFRREDKKPLGLFSANSTVETVKDSQLTVESIDGPLDYRGQLTSKNNIVLSSTRISMSGDLELDNLGENLILCFNPSGSSRNLILPAFPRLDHYIKIINVDGTFPINLRETVSGTVLQEISNASTVLAVECNWDQDDSTWHITA